MRFERRELKFVELTLENWRELAMLFEAFNLPLSPQKTAEVIKETILPEKNQEN